MKRAIILAIILSQFWAEISGGITLFEYLAGEVFILLGVFVDWYIRAYKRVQKNKLETKAAIKTPSYFSWKIFWYTKIPRKIISIIFNIVTGFIFMRFVSEILEFHFSMFACFVIGLTFDNLITKLSKLNFSNIKKNG